MLLCLHSPILKCLTVLLATKWSVSPLRLCILNGDTEICIYTNMCSTDCDYRLNILLQSNIYGKRPADYASSLEMQEIFQEASGETPFVNTAHSNSAGLSMVCIHNNVNNLLFYLLLF